MKQHFDLLTDADYGALFERLCAWRDKKVRLSIDIKPYAKKRSTEANRYYWGVVVKELAAFTGYSPAEMHDELLGAWCGWETRTVRGHPREFPRRRSTFPETMETLDFAGLIETGMKIAAELGCAIPEMECAS